MGGSIKVNNLCTLRASRKVDRIKAMIKGEVKPWNKSCSSVCIIMVGLQIGD